MNTTVFATVCEALILTGLFMGSILYIITLQPTAYSLTECLSFSGCQYRWTSDGWLALNLSNHGISNVTVINILVNNATECPVNPSLPFSVEPGQTLLLNITMSFEEYPAIELINQEYQMEPLNQGYQIELFTLRGSVFQIGIGRIV